MMRHQRPKRLKIVPPLIELDAVQVELTVVDRRIFVGDESAEILAVADRELDRSQLEMFAIHGKVDVEPAHPAHDP